MDYKKIAIISLTFVLAYALKQKFSNSEFNELDEQGLNLSERAYVNKLIKAYKSSARSANTAECMNQSVFIYSALINNKFIKKNNKITLTIPYGASKKCFNFGFNEI